MKVWRATYHDEDEGCCVVWAGTKLELARKLLAERGDREEPLTQLHVARMEVPRTRADLVAWLSVYISRNNG